MVVHDDAQVAGCAEYFLQAQLPAVGHTRFDSTTGHTTWKPKLQTSARKTLHFSAALIVCEFYLQFPDTRWYPSTGAVQARTSTPPPAAARRGGAAGTCAA